MTEPAPPTDEWAPPKWAAYNKHFPVPRVVWAEVVASTGRPKGIAKYFRNLTPEAIEEMEMAAVKVAGRALPMIKPGVRAFWSKLAHIIGASKGEETEYIYVEWHRTGAVHGRPMTKAELVHRGMPA